MRRLGADMYHSNALYACNFDENGDACGAHLVNDDLGLIPKKNGAVKAPLPDNAIPCYIVRVGNYVGFGITISEARANARYCMRFSREGNLFVSLDLIQRWITNDREYGKIAMATCSGAKQRRASASKVWMKQSMETPVK